MDWAQTKLLLLLKSEGWLFVVENLGCPLFLPYEYGRPALRWQGDIEDHISAAVKKLVKAVEP